VAEIRRKRRTSVYRDISQFQRLNDEYDYDPHAFSLSLSPSSASAAAHKSYSVHSTQIWNPSFTFHFSVSSVIQRTYRRIYCFLFTPQGQRLPYFNPTVPPSATSSQGSFASNKLLTFLSRDDTNIFGHDQHHSSSRFVPRFVSYYWNRFWSKPKRGQE